MTRFFLAAALLAGSAAPALADMCAANPKQVADSAVLLLSALSAAQSYCEPCGDKAARLLPIHKAAAVKDQADNTYEVQVDGKPIDLAYVYVPRSSTSQTWINLGMLVHCAPVNTIDTLQLPDALVAR